MTRLISYKHPDILTVLSNATDLHPLRVFVSPTDEVSVLKHIPNTAYYHGLVNRLAKILKIKRRYRGPRYDPMALNCLKCDANTFAVYTITNHTNHSNAHY